MIQKDKLCFKMHYQGKNRQVGIDVACNKLFSYCLTIFKTY